MTTTLQKHKQTLPFINEVVDKKGLNKLLSQVYLECGGAKTATLANSLKNLGFKYATKAGTTISISATSAIAFTKAGKNGESIPSSLDMSRSGFINKRFSV